MNRRDLQSLSRERLRDARVLLTNGQHVGAYYMAGYQILQTSASDPKRTKV